MGAGHEREVYFAAYSPDGGYVVTASDDRTAKIWDAATGECKLTLAGHELTSAGHDGWVNSAAYSPDGAFVITASSNRTAKIWDAAIGECKLILTGHEFYVLTAVCSPFGR